MTHWLQESTISLQHKSAVSEVYNELKHWLHRYPQGDNTRLFDFFALLFLSAKKEFLDHREPHHLARLVLSLLLVEQKLQRLATQFPEAKHIQFKIFPVTLFYPFSSKKVLSCLVGAYLPDSYDRFDEQSIAIALQKIVGSSHLIAESVYPHPTKNKNLHLLYVEFEKRDCHFTLAHRRAIRSSLKENLLRTIQKLFPIIFMRRNQEEVFKNILLLSQQIETASDLPQVMISLEEQTAENIIFLITLVTVDKNPLFDSSFIIERNQVVRHLSTGESLRAHLIRLPLQRDPDLFRSDGSLNFYSARDKVVKKLQEALGPFRDCNGGLLLKQGELLQHLREAFPAEDSELIENFFYSLSPLERQATLPVSSLRHFFAFFLEATALSPPKEYIFRSQEFEHLFFISIQSSSLSLKEALLPVMSHPTLTEKEIIYSALTIGESFYFTCMLSNIEDTQQFAITKLIRDTVQSWHDQKRPPKTIHICLETNVSSLDPRIGGDDAAPAILKMLFEGLMRINNEGQVEPALAEKVTISEDGKKYTFHLRPSFWNDGSPLTAYDFEYAWKTILSPQFDTAFDYFFHPILNAKQAKQGLIPVERVGIHALNDRTLEVWLAFPASYFLELTAHPLYSPIHHKIDMRCPEWPNLTGKSYPCNGPFELKVNHPNNGYHLVKNPHFWDPSHLDMDKMIFTRVPHSQITDLFEKKEIDLVSFPLVDSNATQPNPYRSTAIDVNHNLMSWCVLSTQSFPFNSAEHRRMFAAAIDKNALSSLFPFKTTPAHSPVPLTHSQISSELPAHPLQPLDFSSQTIELLFNDSKERFILARYLQQTWQKAFNIECKLVPLSWTSLFQRIKENAFQVALTSWTSWIDDPIYTLNTLRFAREKINFSKWENPLFQNILEKAENEISKERRLQLLKQAEEILVQEMPIIPLYHQNFQAILRKNLSMHYHPTYGYFNLLRTIKQNGVNP
ncbi:MAG: peptide ABC transporter substrate-binding protein [Verrucomicrobia bacterium]|nr:peptide ABC transporter substrate-binding protein [Verrucomicrobiota bacterium]